MSLRCFQCGAENHIIDNKVSFREDCSECSQDLHCCRACRFYDAGAYNECRESSADVVRDKEKANYCDYFQVSDLAGTSNKKEDLLAAAEALFKK